MARFRKKPVVIEAVQVSAMLASIGARHTSWPAWANAAFEDRVLHVGDRTMLIKTLEGEMIGDHADWVIRGVKGELYPCKPDIFAATYEAVVDSSEPEPRTFE
jgi:hypothetical protein